MNVNVKEITYVINSVNRKRTRNSEDDPVVAAFFDLDRYYGTSVSAASASDLPSQATQATTVETSDTQSTTPSYDLPMQDCMMRDTGTIGRNMVIHGGQQPGLDSPPLFPELTQEHKKVLVVDRPLKLRGLPPSPNAWHNSRALAPRPGRTLTPVISYGHAASPGSPESPSGPGDLQKPPPRTRTVDRVETAKTRNAKGCIRCKIHKVICGSKNPCDTCENLGDGLHERGCIRTPLESVLRSGAGSLLDGGLLRSSAGSVSLYQPMDTPTGRWVTERQDFTCSVDRPTCPEKFMFILSSRGDRYPLRVSVANYSNGRENLRIVNCANYGPQILDWAARELLKGPSGDFQRSIEAFLHLYSKRNCPKKEPLVDHVVKMVALWRLVTASDLHCVIDEPGQHLRLLPASIKSQLTHYAQREMFTTEEKVFNETRSLLSPTFRSQESPAIWAALWSIILLYRQALLMNQQKVMYFNDKFDEVTSKLFDGLVIILSCRFRTRKSLESLDLPIQPAFLGDPTIKMAYDRAQDERSGFYEEIRRASLEMDKLLDKHVVEQECRVRERPKPRAKQGEPVERVY